MLPTSERNAVTFESNWLKLSVSVAAAAENTTEEKINKAATKIAKALTVLIAAAPL